MRCTPSIKSCSKRSFRDIPPVSEELPENPFVEVHVFQGGSVVHIARSQKKIKQFSLVIDDQLKFESIEPSKGVFSFPGKILEGFMLLFSFDMTASDVSRIEKRYTSTLSERWQAEYRLYAPILQIGCRTRYGGNQTSSVFGQKDRNASGLEKRRSGKG